jgi:hypothetical protein
MRKYNLIAKFFVLDIAFSLVLCCFFFSIPSSDRIEIEQLLTSKIDVYPVIAVFGVILFLSVTTSLTTLTALIISGLRVKAGIEKVVSNTFVEISKFLFSAKTQKDTFEPIVADWQEEYFEALHKKEIWKVRWINVRYTYAFIMAMWQKSPLGDLLEYVRKIAS